MSTIIDYPEKLKPAAGDWFLLADSDASYAFKKVGARNLALNPVETKAALALLPTQVQGVIVKRRTLLSPTYAYAGIFHWSSSDHSTDVERDPAGGCFVPPTTDLTGASGCWVRQYENSRIRPEWFGDDYTHVAFQLACNFLAAGDGLEIQPGDIWVFSEPVKLRTDYSKIACFCERPEYYPVFRAGATNLAGLILIQCRGVSISGLTFHGTTDEVNMWVSTMGTSNGLVFDLTEVANNEEWGANIDSIVARCTFVALKHQIVGRGRNLKIVDNTFTGGAIAILGDFYLYGASVKSAFRGWEVMNNRFHSVGAARVYLHNIVTPTVCIKFPQVEETIPTGGPAISDNLIENNHSDWSVGLYEGSIHTTTIKNNHCVKCCGPLVWCDCLSASPSNQYAIAAINGNTWEGRADAGLTEYYYTARYAIYLNNVVNVQIANNIFSSSGLEMIKVIGDSYWVKIHNNTLIYPNNAYARLGDAPAIYVEAIASMTISQNDIWGGTSWGGILLGAGCAQFVQCYDNNIEPPLEGRGGEPIASNDGTSQWAYPAYHHFQISADEDEHGAWVLHPYAYYDGSRYRRVVLDGFVEAVHGLKVTPSFPANAGAAGQAGEIRASGDYLYFCTTDNTWIRVQLATW